MPQETTSSWTCPKCGEVLVSSRPEFLQARREVHEKFHPPVRIKSNPNYLDLSRFDIGFLKTRGIRPD